MAAYLDRLEQEHSDIVDVLRDPPQVLARRSSNTPKVGVVSGCGEANGPMMSGYVGHGMLDAACPGPGLAAPGVEQIVAASRAVRSDEGVLHIVPHFKGDSEAFQAAADALRAEGVRVRDVVIDDDISSRDTRHTHGRRALGTMIVAARICGAAAEHGDHLNHLAALCRQVNANGKSIAAGIAAGGHIEDSEIAVGIGLTGEPAPESHRFRDAAALAQHLASRILADGPFTRMVTEWDVEHWRWHEVQLRDTVLRAGDRVIALVSSLGPDPVCDLDAFAAEVARTAAESGVEVVRQIAGHLMSAPEPAGVSVTLVKVDEDMLRLWDSPVAVPALPRAG